MPFDLSDPDGYFAFLGQLQEVAGKAPESGMSTEGVTVNLWIPSAAASTVASELSELDMDARRVAAWQPRMTPQLLRRLGRPPFFFEALYDLGLPPGGLPLVFPPVLMPEPLRPEEGRFEVQRAVQGSSLEIDLVGIGLVVQILVDVPTLFIWSRMLLRRLPVRIVWRRSTQDSGEARIIEAHHGYAQAGAIEAGRVIRRVTLRYPDGSELIEEDFAPPSDEAA